jgi:hypothetical protein
VYTTSPIIDKSCSEFVRNFFSELLEGANVQFAFAEAKAKMTDEADKIELGGASPSHDVRAAFPHVALCVCITGASALAGARI